MRPKSIVLLFLLLPLGVRAETVSVSAETWASPRSGQSVSRIPELGRLVAAFDRDPESRILIRHAGGDEGALWAEELRSWLVSLGVPSGNIVLGLGVTGKDAVVVELERRSTAP